MLKSDRIISFLTFHTNLSFSKNIIRDEQRHQIPLQEKWCLVLFMCILQARFASYNPLPLKYYRTQTY